MTSGIDPVAVSHRGDPARPPVMGGVPRAKPEFTGREAILQQIHDALSSRPGARYLLGGGSGVGKSVIAAEYARRYAEHYDLVWWFPSATGIDAHRAYLRLAERIDLPVSYAHMPRTVQTVRQALAHDSDLGRWLLVFDDADDVETLVGEYVPDGGDGHVLITSQDPRWLPRGRVPGQVVPRLGLAESLALLRLICPERLALPGAGERLAERLEHLPLALSQVGAFLRESAMGTDEFLDRFEDHYTRLVSQMGTDHDHTAPLAAAWRVQAEDLSQGTAGEDGETGRMVLELVRLCAFLAPRPLSRTIFSRSSGLGSTPDQARLLGDATGLGRVLAYLGRHNLAHFNHERDTFQLHELFQAVIRDSLSLDERLHYRGLAQLVLARNDPADPADPANRTDYLLLFAHVTASSAWSSRDSRVRGLVLNVIDFLTEAGNYPDAVSLTDQAVNAWWDDERRLLHARLRRNKIRRIQGEYVTALSEAREVHSRQLDREGADSDETLEAHRAVAIALSGLARFDEAERIFQQIRDHRRSRSTEADAHTLEAAHDYGQVLQEQGRFEEALAVDERNLEDRRSLLGENNVQTLRTGLALGLDLLLLGRLEEAQERIGECMRRFEVVHAAVGPHALQGLLFLSVIHRGLGDTDRALEYSHRALGLYRRRHPSSVRPMLYCRVVHMVTLAYAGRLPQALSEVEGVLPSLDERFPKHHPFRAIARVSAAIVLRASGLFEQALEFDQEGYERLREIYGPGAFNTLPAALNLASDLYLLGRLAEARELDALTEADCRLHLSADHPILLTARRNHLVSRRAAGEDVDEEWAALREVLDERFGPDHPSVVSMSSFIRQDCDVLSAIAV